MQVEGIKMAVVEVLVVVMVMVVMVVEADAILCGFSYLTTPS